MHVGLKIQCPFGHEGSNPSSRTNYFKNFRHYTAILKLCFTDYEGSMCLVVIHQLGGKSNEFYGKFIK